MKRNLWKILATLVVLAVLAGCAQPTPEVVEKEVVETVVVEKPVVETVVVEKVVEVTPVPEEVEIRIAWWGSQTGSEVTIAAIELFQELYPNIKCSYEFAGWNDYWTLMKTQTAGGNLPDVMNMSYAYVEDWSDRGLLTPLDEFVEDGTLDLDNVSQGALDWFVMDGKTYGLPLGISPETWVLDLDAFEQAGMELPPQDWTWDDFERITLELHEKLGIWGNGIELSHIQDWQSMMLGYGESLYSPDGQSLAFTDEPTIEFFNMILRLQEAGAIPTREEEVEYQTAGTNPFVEGEAAMRWLGGSNMLTGLWRDAGEDRNLRLIHIPRPEGGQPSVYIRPSMGFSVPVHSRHPKEATMFINWFINSIEAAKIVKADNGVAVSSVIREALIPDLGRVDKEIFEYVGRVEPDCSPRPNPWSLAHADIRANVYYVQLADPILYGLLTPEEALENFRAEANAAIAVAYE
jgi:multiple sugar transport system substrate-binding protein